MDRKHYQRESESTRRDALIAAALALVADGGPAAATTRAIAEKAGVTAGLIRHYFSSKDELTRAAYRQHIDTMTQDSVASMVEVGEDPVKKLAAFVTASLSPPVVDPLRLSIWASFLVHVRKDPDLRAAHVAGYHTYRDVLETLIAALPRSGSAAQSRADAIACNALIDGLWLEGSAVAEAFGNNEIANIGLQAVSAIVGVDLTAKAPLK